MTYLCRRCRAALSADAFACPGCKRKFALPVPVTPASKTITANAGAFSAEEERLWPAYAEKTRGLPYWSLAVVLGLTLAFGAITLMRAGWVAAAKRAALHARQAAEYRDRHTYAPGGMALLTGPFVPGGPTLGDGKYADMEIVDFGWNFYGSWVNPREKSRACASVKNKTDRTWNNVTVLLNLTRRDGTIMKDAVLIGKVRRGETHFGEGSLVDDSIAYSRITGITGN